MSIQITYSARHGFHKGKECWIPVIDGRTSFKTFRRESMALSFAERCALANAAIVRKNGHDVTVEKG